MLSSQDSRFLVTLYAQDVGMYLCFNKGWKLIGLVSSLKKAMLINIVYFFINHAC